jgi:DNA integrity scanning protein DisA with diadenylate cyclase activity
MTVEHGQPSLPREPLDQQSFHEAMLRTFGAVVAESVGRIWKCILQATKQKHGTMIVISDHACEEAQRLQNQCTAIKPISLQPKRVALLTAIDGAVLIDCRGRCYAIGVILDGLSSDLGDPSRGARYNSAVRYIETATRNHNRKCLAIVVSVDGLVDLVTG